MATIGNVIAKFGADISGFQSDMGRAAKIADNRGKEMKKHLVGATKAIAAGAAVAGGAIAAMVTKSISEADKFQKLSERIGGSSEAFSQLEYVAERSGIKFETMTMGLQRMTRRLGEVAFAGKGEAKPALEAMGLVAEDLVKLPLDKQFEAIAEALSQVENSSDRTRLAMKIFDSEGVSLLQTMTKGAKGIQDLRSEADKLGITVSTKTAKAAATFNDRLTMLKATQGGVITQLSAKMLPALNKLMLSMVDVGDSTNFAAKAADFLTDIFKVLVSAGIVVKNIFEAIGIVIGNFAGIVVSVFEGISGTIGAFVDGVGTAFTLLKEGEFKQAGEAMSGITGDMKTAFDTAKTGIISGIDAIAAGVSGEFTEAVEGINDLWDGSVDVMENDVAPALQQTAIEFRASADDMVESAGDITGELEEIIVTAERMPVPVANAAEEIKEEFANPSTGVAAVIENTFKRLDNTFQSFWSDLLKNGKISLSSLKDLFLDTLAQLLHAAITQPIVLRIGAAMTGGLASGTASAAGGAAGGMFGGMFGAPGSGWGGFNSSVGGGMVGGMAGMFASSQLFGGSTQVQTGSMIGAVAGGIIGSFIPVLGTAIGAFLGGLVGGFIGSLFKSKAKISAGSFNIAPGDSQFFDSKLGGVYVGKTKGGMDEHVGEFGEAISQFDDMMTSFMTGGQIDAATNALKRWQMTLVENAISVEAFLSGRFSVVLGTFGDIVQDYVKSFDGFEDKTAAFERIVRALNTLGATVSNFVSIDISKNLDEQFAYAAKNSTQKLQIMGDTLLDLFGSFDGTPEALNEITQAVDARYRGELEYLTAIRQLIDGISQSIAKQQQDIREAIEGPKSYGELVNEANRIFNQLGAAGSPEELAQMVNQIQSLVGDAFGGLEEGARAGRGNSLIKFLDLVEAAATSRANELAQMVIDEGVILREQALMFAESIGAPLDLNVQATDAVNDSINRQTGVIEDGQESNDALLRELIDAIRAGNDLLTVRP